MPKSFEQKVIQLVGISQKNQQLYLTQQGKCFLEEINAPIAVVTIAGLYRTGKSYLVNQLLSKLSQGGSNSSNQSSKFAVGDTVQSCTKGMNVWAVPFQSTQNKPNFYYIVVDSEGIGSMQQQQNYDINLLMLIFLISSTVIYNSVGAIDEQSLDQLRVVVNLRKSLGEQPNTQPRLVWVLRDFALQLINKNGEDMTSDEYLQDCLELVSSSNKQVVKKNEIRQAIKQSLPNRECHTLVRPTIKQQDLSNLNSLPKTKLRTQFISQVNNLYESVFTHSAQDIKFLNDEQNLVDGPGLSKMIEYYLSEINCNKVPEVRSVWELIQTTKMDELIQQCENQLKTQTLKIDLPLSEEQLKQRLNQIQNRIFCEFQKQLPPSDLKTFKKFNQQFIKLTHKINTKIRKANQEIKKKKQLKKVRDTINKEIHFDQIDPCEISGIRQVIEGLELKGFADSQIYEYVINSVLDVMEIAQEKAIKLKEELQEYELNQKQTEVDKSCKQEQLIKLKHNYHEALKEISYLKNSQMENEKDLAVSRQELGLLESKLLLLSGEKLQKQQELRRKIQQLNQKIRKKHEQSAQSMKCLRTQNQSLISQLQEAKRQLNQRRQQDRRETIFQDKIKQSWDRFQQERTYFKKELQKFKQMYFQAEERARTLAQKEQNLDNVLKKQRELFAKKEKQFCEQLRWMKENYAKTKDAYNQSYNTRIENEQILKEIATQGARKKNVLQAQNENILVSNNNSKAERAELEQMTSACESLRTERALLQKEVTALQSKLQKQQKEMNEMRQFYQRKIDRLEEQVGVLQSSNQGEKERFYSCLKELEEAKEAQRQMYEDSIMRLLNNMEGYEPAKGKGSKVDKMDRNGSVSSSHKAKKYLY